MSQNLEILRRGSVRNRKQETGNTRSALVSVELNLDSNELRSSGKRRFVVFSDVPGRRLHATLVGGVGKSGTNQIKALQPVGGG